MMNNREQPEENPEKFVSDLAIMMAFNCVRNTVIEDYHRRGSVSPEDLKVFNKQVVDKLYTYLRILFNGSPEEQAALLKVSTTTFPFDWAKPTIDSDLDETIRMAQEDQNEADS
jgi:hypothetical protein